MFAKSARFYDLIYSWKDYEAETRTLLELIEKRCPGAKTLLDVACGTGKHLELLAPHFATEGLDLDTDLLAIARERLPDASLHVADMRDFDLGVKFDVVTCLFSAIGYMPSIDDYERAVDRMAAHLAPDGLLIVEPWIDPGAWKMGDPFGLYVDEPDIKIARMNINEPIVDGTWHITFHYMIAEGSGVSYFTEDHTGGMFTRDQQLDAFRKAGLEVEYDPLGLMGRGLFLASSGRERAK